MMTGRVVTFQLMLQDEPGVLSEILKTMAYHKTNILTINSIIPNGGCALVTISAETIDMDIHLEDMLRLLSGTPGVVKAEIVAG
jgi:chorismate mutase